jgi:outer membrane protein TolC
MFSKKSWFLVCLLWLTVSICPVYSEPKEVEVYIPELARLLQSARDQAPALIEQAITKEEADARLKQAKAAYYPRLDLLTNFGYRKDYRSGAEDTDNLGMTYSAALRRPLYHWGAIEAKIEQARLSHDNATLRYLYEQQQTERRIRADYLALILDNIALQNEEKKQVVLQSNHEIEQINFEAGKTSALAYKKSEVSLKKSLLTIERIQLSKKRILERFQQYAGWGESNTTPLDIPAIDTTTTTQWLIAQHDALMRSNWIYHTKPALLQINAIQHQKEELTQIKARQKPLIDTSFTASQRQTNTSLRNNVDTFSVFGGVRVQWNIFDGFETRHEKIEALAKIRRLEYGFDQLDDTLKLQANEVLDSLLFQTRTLELTEAQHKVETAEYNLQKEALETGRITQTQLRSESLQFNKAKLALHQARANLHIGLSDYLDLVSPIR